MKQNLKKTVALATSLVVTAGSMAFSSFTSSADSTTRYEFEDSACTTYTGTIEAASDSAASGGKVLYMQEDGDITVTVTVDKTDMYDIILAADGVGGAKQQSLYVNGTSAGSISIAEGSSTYSPTAVTTVQLNEGENTIKISKSWGWTKFDYLEVQAKTYDTVSGNSKLSDPSATKEAQSLMNYLASVYGSHTISGQQEIYQYGPHDFETEFSYIYDTTGEYPAIRGFDFLNQANPLYGSDDGTTDRIISWCTDNQYGTNGIATASWHITVPKDFASYTIGDSVSWSNATYVPKETDFDASNVCVEGTKEYEYYQLCLKQLAAALQELDDANVPLIFRPLHEAEGGGGETGSWFWWGKSGSSVYKDIWKLTYTTLTETYGLHNLIWEWNGYDYTTSGNWYPGDEYVDLVAYDKYSCTKYLAENNWNASLEHDDTAAGSTYWSLVNLTNKEKMVAMAECDCISTLSNLETAHATWLYFCPWYDGGSDNINFLSNEIFNTKEDLTEMYQSDYCITLDELPADLYSNAEGEFPTDATTETKAPKETEATTEAAVDEATIKAGTDGTAFSFDSAMGDTIYFDINVPSGINYVCGGACFNVTVDGTDYWVGYQWELNKSGTATIDLTKPSTVTTGSGDDVTTVYSTTDSDFTNTDEGTAIAEACATEVQKLKAGTYQAWWAADSTWAETSHDDVTLVKAWKDEAETSETEATEATETTEEVKATTVTEAVEKTTTTVTEAKEETTEATEKATEAATEKATSISSFTRPSNILYGDVNMDATVNISDVVLLNKYLVHSAELSETALYSADCTYSSSDDSVNVDAKDSLAILKYLVKSVESLPVIAD